MKVRQVMEAGSSASCRYSAALEGVATACHLMTRIQTILDSSTADPVSDIAHGLVQEAQLSMSRALSLLSLVIEQPAGDGRHLAFHYSKEQPSMIVETCIPDWDDHRWTKYRQKNNAHGTPRWYYRCCHYKDQLCPAIKTVKPEEGSSDSTPKFRVSYTMHHTCSASSSTVTSEASDTPNKKEATCHPSYGVLTPKLDAAAEDWAWMDPWYVDELMMMGRHLLDDTW